MIWVFVRNSRESLAGRRRTFISRRVQGNCREYCVALRPTCQIGGSLYKIAHPAWDSREHGSDADSVQVESIVCPCMAMHNRWLSHI